MNTNVGITQQALEMDSGEKRLHELGYKQELRREMVCLKPSHISKVIYANLVLNHISYFYVGSRKEYLTLLIYAFFFFFFSFGFLQTLFKTLAITFSSIAVFSGTPLYGPSLRYAGPASLIWGWVVVTFFTWFVGLALAEICSSFPVCFLFVIYIFFLLDYSLHKRVVWKFTLFSVI